MRFLTSTVVFIQVLFLFLQIGCSHKEIKELPKNTVSKIYHPKIIECEKGLSHSCIEMGLNSNDPNESAQYFKKACDLKSEVGCGIIIFYLDPDSKTAKDLFGRSCYLRKDKIGCGFLGYYNAREGKTENALNMFKKSCEMGFYLGCQESLKVALKNKDRKKIISLADRSCELGNKEICFFLGQYFSGLNQKKEALNYTLKGCKLEDGKSCYLAGLIYQSIGKIGESQKSLIKSCTLNEAKGCYYLGETQLLLNNNILAIGHLNKSCELGLDTACMRLARYYSENNLKNDALVFYVKGCQITPKNSSDRIYNCMASAQYMAQFFDTENSVELFEKVCEVKPREKRLIDMVNDACTRLGIYNNKSDYLKNGIQYTKERCEKSKNQKEQAYNCYSLACVYSLIKDTDMAFKYLAIATKNGVLKKDQLKDDFELNNIKGLPEFQQILEGLP